jgi:hypothetical protein
MKMRLPASAAELLTAPPVLNVQRVTPVRTSSALTRPDQSPTYTSPFAMSGDDSVGAIVRRQRIAPLWRSNATTSPSAPGTSSPQLRPMNVWITSAPAIAGDAQPHRLLFQRHTARPVRASSA